ncbi:MAG: energy transducer TonB [Gammaproteobacteria bacterium]|nr:energy transducer TonB [Gammaproteobacteria bacterium]
MKAVPQGPLGGGAPNTARTRRIEAVVLSSDDGLIIDLGPVLGERYRTRPVDSLDEFAAAPPGVERLVLLDAVHRSSASTEAVRLASLSPTTPIVVIVAAGAEPQWSAALARGDVVAVVRREDIGDARLQQALAQAEARLQTQGQPTIPLRTLRPARARSRPAGLVVAAIALIVLAAGIGLLLRNRAAAPTPSPDAAGGDAADTASATTPASTRPALELLSAARIAFRGQHQLPRLDGELKGDSALELYVQALAVEPNNEEAHDGVRRLLNLARPRIQADIAAGRFPETLRLLDLFRSAGVDTAAVALFDGELAAARPRWLAVQVQNAITAGDLPAAEQGLAQLATSGADTALLQTLQQALETRRQDVRLTEMAGAVHAAIGAGNLLEPLADNARTRVQTMWQLNRTHPVTAAAQQEYATALLARSQEAAHSQQFDAAQRYLTAAGDVATPEDLAVGRRLLQSEIDAAAQRTPPAGSTPAAAPTAAATTAAPALINARAIRPLSLTYPAQARAQKITGYVVVEFTLRADGRAYDARVAESEPPGVFDQPALASVADGRFDTSALDPSGEPRRARLRVSFQ